MANLLESGKDVPFSLVDGDALSRIQRRLGVIPSSGLGLKRRALLYAMVAWLPLVIAAVLSGTSLRAEPPGEPLFGHFGIHIRCLVAIPLLVLAEGVARDNVALCLRQFKQSGLVDAALAPKFDAIVQDIVAIKQRMLPWVIILGVVLTWTAAFLVSPNPDEMRWSATDNAAMQLGTWWFLLVTRPIFSTLLLAWAWRLILLGLLLWRIARLPLRLAVQHPDRMGGLGFLERLPKVYGPVLFSLSAVMAGAWAHQVFYHDVPVPALYVQIGTLLAVLVCIGMAPLMVFSPLLLRARRQALLDYGALLAAHGRAVHGRWIERKPITDEPLLDAPELGPVADIRVLYESVANMRAAVISKTVLLKIVVPAALPLLILIATQWPVQTTLTKLLFTLL
ncbi:hypothetical protein CEK29_19735 [Bordetella genomosp. 5]|uniref:hypothetical protein n=1 Tax=Bordetella genomosp. 5 TaxID=1395608 RepID=UPI000B9E3943|nr:hypothetical protein [Bordetella genomosp. 5]OZI38740.1 hypothetical protein CEK29_19735 [Bordetella genomosp. 5]